MKVFTSQLWFNSPALGGASLYAQEQANSQVNNTQQVNDISMSQNLGVVIEDIQNIKETKKKKGLSDELMSFVHSLVLPISILVSLLVVFSFVAASKGRHIIGIVMEPLWVRNNFEEATIKSLRSRMPSIFNMKFFPVYFNWGTQAWMLELQGKTTRLLELRIRKHPIKSHYATRIWENIILNMLNSLSPEEIKQIQEGRLGLRINPNPKYNPRRN